MKWGSGSTSDDLDCRRRCGPTPCAFALPRSTLRLAARGRCPNWHAKDYESGRMPFEFVECGIDALHRGFRCAPLKQRSLAPQIRMKLDGQAPSRGFQLLEREAVVKSEK